MVSFVPEFWRFAEKVLWLDFTFVALEVWTGTRYYIGDSWGVWW